jgi:P4 family phage/plasmid primase-like protien
MFNKLNKNNNIDDDELDHSPKTMSNALNTVLDISDDDESISSDILEHKLSDNYNKNNNLKYKNLQDFIDKNKCAYGDKNYTHNWWDNTNNIIFNVKQDDYDTFLNIYINELKTKYGKLHIMEKPLDVGPLCLDFDVKISEKFRCLEKINITLIIKTINDIIKKYYDISEQQDELISYVLIKEKAYYDNKTKLYSDGFHIQYPNLILDVKDRFLIFEESKNKIVSKGYFDELFKILIKQNLESETGETYEISEDIQFMDKNDNPVSKKEIKKLYDLSVKELFDSSVIKRNCWFLYGSGKKKDTGIFFYKVVHIFDSNVNEYDEIPDTNELVKILAIRNINNAIMPKDDLGDKYNFITNTYMKTNKIQVKNLFIKNDDAENDSDNDVNNEKKKNDDKKNKDDNDEMSEPINIARKLLKLLNKKRAGPYNEWVTVGWTLYNISETLLPEFIEFSRQEKKKFQPGCCEKIWEECSRRVNEGGYTIASLYMWAKEDNPAEYLKLLRTNINKLLENANAKADYDIAMIIKELYKYEYKCTSIKDNTWWQFENHRWKKIDSAYTLGIRLSEDVAKEFALLSSIYLQESTTVTGYKSDILHKKAKDICNLVLDLKKTAYKERIIRECAPLFYERTFEEKLDDNKYLIGFNNGIYDLKVGLFRKGSPDDYISLTADYDYEPKFTDDNSEVKALVKFLTSVFPDDELRKYVLCFISSLLEGGNNDQKMFFWTGSGSNGKGTITDLINVTFGNYFATVPVSLLTVKRRSSSNATPELADKVGKRILVMNEPEHDDEINAGLMKELTGQDRIMARPLYGKPFYYIPQYVPILPCNHLPKLSKSDGGTTRRIRVIEFSQKFVDEPTKPNEHPKDPELRNKLKTWHKPFIWLLLNTYYPIYKKYGIEKLEPDCVKLSTQKYEKDSNSFYEFKEEFISLEPNGRLPKDSISKLFKEWHTNNYTERKLPGSKELFKYLEDELGFEVRNGRFCGIVLKERDQDIDNDQLA